MIETIRELLRLLVFHTARYGSAAGASRQLGNPEENGMGIILDTAMFIALFLTIVVPIMLVIDRPGHRRWKDGLKREADRRAGRGCQWEAEQHTYPEARRLVDRRLADPRGK